MTCVKMQREICARITAFVPAIDFDLVGAESGGNGLFSGSKIGPCRSGRDVAFALEALAELIVGAADMLVESVAAALFIACQIVKIV